MDTSEIEVVAGINQVKKTIAVLSGKGGVGKSTTVSLLAIILAKKGLSVGILDADLCGPSIPVMLGMKGSIHSCDQGWLPSRITVGNGSISAVSLSFLVEKKDEAVVWRGPKKTAMIKQFVTDVCWGKLDVLLVDTPPGTTDEHMAVAEAIPNSSALLVTSPQAVAAADVLRQVSFCRKVSLTILGVVETLSGFVCPTCADCRVLDSHIMGGAEDRPFFYAVSVGLVMVGVAYLLGWVWVPAQFSTIDLILLGVSVTTCFANYVNEYHQWYPLKYSKFAPEGMVPARLGWFMMYFTPMMFYIGIWCYAGQPSSDYDLLILGMYVLHFTKRCTECLVVHKYSKDCCLQTVIEVASFYSLGAGGTFWYAHVSPGDHRYSFLQDRSRVCVGIAFYVLGQLCNLYHHTLLANLRKPGQYGYVVPTGGFFSLIVCPQYFGELLSWFGFGLVGYSNGLLMSGFVPMVVYLSARAHHTHAWYGTKFEDYPGKGVRKIWPFIY